MSGLFDSSKNKFSTEKYQYLHLKIYKMNLKTTTLFAIILLLQLKTKGQATGYLDINEIRAKFESDATLFNGTFEVPQSSFINSIYMGQLWIGGLDSTGQLHMTAQTYRQAGNDLFYGPIADNYLDPSYTQHDDIAIINYPDINAHIQNYTTPGYIVPSEIANWPANGNTLNGEAATLAPYTDSNGNGIYDPENGDYPFIYGDQALYFIANDARNPHTETGGVAMGIEVHGMAFGINTQDTILSQSIFLRLEIINRSSNNYDSVYFGLFVDMDLGYWGDDYIGCDSLRNFFYTYNATNNDPEYGARPPVQGCMLLNHSISKFMYITDDASVQGLPGTDIEYYQYLKGRWRDNTPLTYDSSGYGGSSPANFAYTGNPSNNLGWTERGLINIPGDRKGLMSVGPLTFPAGGEICADFAFPYARNTTGSNFSAVSNLRSRAQILQSNYNSNPPTCNISSNIISASASGNQLRILPNPTNGKFKITHEKNSHLNEGTIRVFNAIGVCILNTESKSLQDEIDLSGFADGIYFIDLSSGELHFSGKVIKN